MGLHGELDNLPSQGGDDRPLYTKPAIFKGIKKNLIALSYACVGLRCFPSGAFASVNSSFPKCRQAAPPCTLAGLHLGGRRKELCAILALASQSMCLPRIFFFFNVKPLKEHMMKLIYLMQLTTKPTQPCALQYRASTSGAMLLHPCLLGMLNVAQIS